MTMNDHPPSSDDVQPEPPVPPVEPEPIPPVEPEPAPPVEPEPAPAPPVEPAPEPPVEPGQPEPPAEPGPPHPPAPPVPPLPPQPGPPEPPQAASPDGAAPAVPAAVLPSLRPTQLPRTLLIGALTTAGIALGTTIVAGLLLALAAIAPLAEALESMGGSSASPDAGAGVLIGFVFVCAGLVLGGEISVQLGGSAGMFSASGGGSAWVFPLVLTLAVLVVTAWWSWRLERRDPQQTVWHRLIASAAAGLAASLVLLLLVAILSPRVEEAGSSFLLTSAGFRLVAVGTLLLTAAGFLGRELGHRTAQGEGLVAAIRRNVEALPAIVREPLVVATIFAVVFTPLAIIGGAIGLVQQDMAGAIPLLLVLCLNVAAALAVIAQLGGIEASAGTSGFGGVSELFTVFGAGQWWLWLAVLVALVTAVLAAVRIGVRRPRGAQVDLARMWQLPAGALIGWIVFALLLFGASAAGAGSMMFFSGEGTVALSIAWWSLLVLLVWAAAISFGAQVLPALVYGLSPRLLEVIGGRAAVATWLSGGAPAPVAGGAAGEAAVTAPAAPPAPPAPMSPRTKKALAWTGGAVALVAVLGVGAAVTLSVVNAGRGPAAAVAQYVGLIADGQAEAASALVDPNVSNAERAFLTDEVLSAAAERISDVEVADGAGEGDVRYIDVTYRLDGVEQSASLEVERLDNEWLVLERWRVATPLLTEVFVYADGGGARIGGVDVPFDESGQATVAVYPGAYDVEPASSAFFEADPVRVIAAGPAGFEGGAAEIDFRPTSALQDEVDAQVKALLDGCAEQAVGQPEDCPFQVYVYPDDTPVTWSIASYPSIEIAEDGTYFTASEGVAEATYIDSGFFSDDEEVTQERDISFSGGIEIDGDAVTVTSDGYWW
ncbi:hypothetical protein [Microbacterium sp. KNMS]